MAVRGLLAMLVVVVGLWVAPVAGAASGPVLSGSVSDPVNLSGATAVAVSDHFAYASVYHAGVLTAIDLSNPAAPVIAGESAGSNALVGASSVNISGGFAYVASKNRNGPNGSGSNDDGTGNSLTILDISTNPAKPQIVGTVSDATKLFGAYGVAVSENYAYIAAQGCLGGQPCPNSGVGNSFEVVDVSDPTHPTIVASLRNSTLPAPWTGTNALAHACSVTVSGHYAYVTAAYSNRLTIIDIANPLAPVIVSSLQDPVALDFPVDVAVKGNYAYVADQASSLGRVAVVDVSDPANPVIAATVTNSSSLDGAYRIRIHGNLAYVSAVNVATVAAVDISNPLAPRVAGHLSDPGHLNLTTGLEVDSSANYVIASSPRLSTQSATPYPPYPLTPGGPTSTGTVSVIQLDPAPIAVSISAKPANPTTVTSASFTFASVDAVSTMSCSLDGAPLGACTSATTAQYAGLAPGAHAFAVQASDSAGNVGSASYAWTVQAAPVNTAVPAVSGTASQGRQLTASTGTWTGVPAPTFAYQWSDCDANGANCTPISGATSGTYTAQGSDVGFTLEVTVTASNSAGSSSATSAPTAVIGAVPANTVSPSILGKARTGSQLTAAKGTWTGVPAPTFSYQWIDCNAGGLNCASIGGATSSRYTPASADVGSRLRVLVAASNALGSTRAISALTGAVLAAPPAAPVIKGVAQSATAWREGGKLAPSVVRRPKHGARQSLPVGTTFSFTLSQPASVRFSFSRQTTGRKIAGVCRRQTTQNRRKPTCRLKLSAGTLTFTAHAGMNKISFDGHLTRTRRLPPGRYTLAITATAAGRRSKTRTISFTIVS